MERFFSESHFGESGDPGEGEYALRKERESFELLARVKSDLDTTRFTLEDIHEVVSRRYSQRHLETLASLGFIEFNSENSAFELTPKGYDWELADEQ
ncbi:MAG: hypothetical protein HY396_01600 [Candidatus Doudnabacteria bacterium]|nr:hypothetical protein [Candidatus Doudnabacteria bacterium]